ncbi:MAG: hypothetical protein MUE85_11605 [Microscillaceae bacterium]|jgi:hypothetical protein|nr:hypothetical protein [Microscillaceae bacterium]
MLLNLTLLIFTALLTFYFKNWYESRKKLPTLSNVKREMTKIFASHPLQTVRNESEIEQLLAPRLGKYFAKVSTQYPIGGIKNARERVDIDVGDGQVGIEIKLARLLRKSNERNRLLGQIELYKERKYKNNNLLVLIVGEADLETEENILELKKILQNKGTELYFWRINEP